MALTSRDKARIGIFGAVGVAAWIAGLGVSLLIAHFAAPADDLLIIDAGAEGEAIADAGTASDSLPTMSTSRSKRDFVDPILERNIFDSTKVGQRAAPEVGGDSGNKSDLKVVLLATVVSDPPQYSSALIAEEKSKSAAVGYGIGDTLLGEAKIHRIEQKRVVIIRNDGTVEYIGMDPQKTKDLSRNQPKGVKLGGGKTGVTKDGDNKWIVDADVVEKAMENPEKLASQIRAMPHKGSDGEVDGYRLSGVRRSSLFNKLGIRNGDIVHQVNGHELNSISSAMEAYNSMQSEKNFSFEITRRNKRQTFEYEVR